MVNPGFFKCYISSLGEENMKIPRFSESIQGTWPATLTLRDRYSNLWPVNMELVRGTWYFRDGWTKFIKDNMIKDGDVIVYEYSSRGLLDFKVFGSTACMTKGVGCRKIHCEGEQVTEGANGTDEAAFDHTTDEEENLQDDYLGIDEVIDVTSDSDDDDYYFPTTDEGDQQDDYKVMDVDDDVAQEVSQERTHEEGRRVGSTPTVQVRDNGGASTSKPRSSRDFDWFGVEFIRSGRIRQPRNPYFVTKKRKQRSYELYVPMEVIRDYGLELPVTTLLLDPEGREFRATRKIWSDGRKFYTGGWKSLCKTNMVGDEDFCICEFVRRGQDLLIHVSFVRPNVQQ